MKKLTLPELQKIELNILIALDALCRACGIKYSLGYGTLIGAVRHEGFIPWDDDIDIMMCREEYEKLKEVLERKQFIIDDRYKVLMPGDEGYPYPFIKVIDMNTILYEKNVTKYELGVWIDIFPIDYCPWGEEEALKIIKSQFNLWINYSRGRYSGKIEPKANGLSCIIKKLLWYPVFKISNKKFRRQLLINEERFSHNKKSDYMCLLAAVMKPVKPYPSEYFEGYTEILFENYRFMVFKRYDDILTHDYGNYMELPPENQRVSHNPEAYIK